MDARWRIQEVEFRLSTVGFKAQGSFSGVGLKVQCSGCKGDFRCRPYSSKGASQDRDFCHSGRCVEVCRPFLMLL